MARKLFNENKDSIDVIVQDYILPGVKGETLLTEFSAGSDIPIIVTSAYSGELDNSAIIKKGAYAYVAKPFKIDELVKVIQKALQSVK